MDEKKVLVVDDEPLVLNALSRVISQEGYQASPFSSAREALDALEAVKPDCIFADFYMPKTDGLDLLEQAKQRLPDAARVLITGGYVSGRVHEAMEREIVQVLVQKPWNFETIRKAMGHVWAGDRGIWIRQYQSTRKSKTPVLKAGRRVSGAAAKPPSVLVVDDSPLFLEMMNKTLSGMGYRVLLSASGEQAFENIRESRPDLVMVDMILPSSGGLDLLRAFRDLLPGTPLVAVTGSEDRNLAVEIFRLGATALVDKFSDEEMLDATLRRCLQLANPSLDLARNAELSSILNLQHAIASELPSSELLYLLLQEMIRYTSADAASLMLLEPDGQTLRVAAAYRPDERMVTSERLAIGEGLPGYAAKYNQPQLLLGESTNGKSNGREPRLTGMALPMRGRDGIRGVLCVSALTPQLAFPSTAVDLGLLLGGELARALDRREAAERQKELELSMMQHDKLATLGEMASGMAHEINNPLAFISSNLSSMDSYLEDIGSAEAEQEETIEELKACLSETQQGVDRVVNIVADMKDLARSDGAEKEEADVNELLDGALNIVWNQIKYKVEVVREYAHLPPVGCFPSQLGQVFLNLIHNAGQAIEKDGKITLRTWAEQDRVMVEVTDNGKGMEPEVSRQIFKKFYTTKPRGIGTGLGLSIASKIIARHQGSIDLESTPGRGTTFRVSIPIGPRDGLS